MTLSSFNLYRVSLISIQMVLFLGCKFSLNASEQFWDKQMALEYLIGQIRPLETPSNIQCPIEGIDNIYVINLDIRPDKMTHVQNEAKKFNLNPIRLSAVNGWKLDPEFLSFYKASHPRPNAKGRSPGEIGVLLSHLSIMHHMLKQEYQAVWIWEDDIKIKQIKELSEVIKELNTLDPNWDILYTDGGPYKGHDLRNDAIYLISKNYFSKKQMLEIYNGPQYFSPNISRIFSKIGCYSMIVSKNGARKIIDHFSQNLMRYALDVDIHFLKLNMYRTKKVIATHYDSSFQSDSSCKPATKDNS